MGKNAGPPANYKAPWQGGSTTPTGNSGFPGSTGGSAMDPGGAGFPRASASSSGQPPLDFYGAANAQGQSSQANIGAQTWANRPDQSNPFATSSWTQGPDGRWTQTSAFNGGLGAAASGWEAQLAGQKPLDFSGVTAIDTGDKAREAATDAAYKQAASRLDPQWSQRDEQMHAQLAAQGLDPSSQAAQTEQSNFGRDRNDAYSSAQRFAVGQGLQAQQQAFQQSLGARQQQIAEILRQRTMPLEQLQGLQGLLQQSGFMGAGAAAATPWLSAAEATGNYGLGQANAENQLIGGAMQGLGSLGAAGIMASDERLKQNIERHDEEAIPGVPLATFEYRHEPGKKRLGVIAQDLERVAPQLVQTGPDGIKRVPNRPPFAF